MRGSIKSSLWKPGAAALIALGLAACTAAPTNVRVDRAEVDFAKCRTFSWLPARQDAASFSEQRVRAAVLQRLQQKGYAEASDAPDCRITYLLAAREEPKKKPSIGVGAGGGSGGVGGGIGISIPLGRKNHYVGVFTLDVIDVASNAQIWSGALDTSFADAELTEEEARDVVGKVLAEFPDRASPQSAQ